MKLESDIEKVGEMGRIINNSRAATPPLTIFNPMKFSVYEYSEKVKNYREVQFIDDEAIILRVPR